MSEDQGLGHALDCAVDGKPPYKVCTCGWVQRAEAMEKAEREASQKRLYRKKPTLVDAVQWRKHGDHPKVRRTSYDEVSRLLGTSGCSREEPYWAWMAMGMLDTPEGLHAVIPGDWIIQGVMGEFYPCKPEIFEKTYERI